MMIINLILLSVVFFNQHNPFADKPAVKSNATVAAMHTLPKFPLIERDEYGQYLNFDMIVNNTSKHVLDISAIQVSVLANDGKLILRKLLNNNGRPPGITTVGNTIIKPGQSIIIYNPFHTFNADIKIGSLKYEFDFDYADTRQQQVNNKQRLPIDFDCAITSTVMPKEYVAKTNLTLPLKGKMIVWDGHDFYSHHRRFPVGLPEQEKDGFLGNSIRYSYDFISIDAKANLYKNSPFKKENWFVFGNPIFAPGTGKVVSAANNIPDNEFKGATIIAPKLGANVDPKGLGNHVIIDHGNGEYSVLMHMEKGSVKVKPGDMVKQGQYIGNIGFSGDAICPHLHYMIMDGDKYFVSEGLPSYFHSYKLYRGDKVIIVKKGRIDSGDIIETAK